MRNFLKDIFGFGKDVPKKKAVVHQAGYEAAAFTKDRSVIYSVDAESYSNPDVFVRSELLRLTRYLVENYPLMGRILSVTENYAVGAGLMAAAVTKDAGWNELASKEFDRWASSCFCTADHYFNFYQIQKLIARELPVAGEVFFVLQKADTGFPQVMLVKSEQVRHSGKPEDKSIEGIYFNEYGQATAYNIFTGKSYQVVDAANVVHIMVPRQIGQKRGLSSFPASINSARDIKDIEIQLKRNVKAQNLKALVVTKKTGQADSGAFGPLTTQDDAAEDGIKEKVFNYGPNVGLETAVPGASVAYLNEGEDIESITSDSPTQNNMDFLEFLTREVCLSIGLPYSFLVDPSAVTGTGMRFVINDADKYFKGIQDLMIDGGLNRIYFWVISCLIKQGVLPEPKNDFAFHVSWTRPQSITIDSQRVSNTEIALLEAGLLTLEGYWSARGLDWKEQVRQRLDEKAFIEEEAKARGLRLPTEEPVATSLTEKEEEDTGSNSSK